jgi:flavin-dependent dehydrogenase
LNRGVYDTGLIKKRSRPALPELLNIFTQKRGNTINSNQIQGHPIHLFNPRLPLSIPGLLLAGDSAGIDPLFGEGIAPSLAYGQVAAWSIQDAFRRNDFSLDVYRRNVINSGLGDYLTIRWILANWIYRFANIPVFMHLFWTFAQMVAFLWPPPKPLYGE